MKWLRELIIVALCLVPVCAEAWWQSIQQVAISTATYQGAGDTVSGAKAWWGLRAYNAADRGNPLIHVCIPLDVSCANLVSDATTGALVIPTIGGSSCSVVTCTIDVFYDRSGALLCAGTTACDATQIVIASRAQLIVSCINSRPCARFTGGQGYTTSAVALTAAQPYAYSAVASRTNAFGAAGMILTSTSLTQLNFRQSASTFQMFAGTAGQTIPNITDNSWHAFNATYNGASSVLFCGGSAGAGCSNVGTSNPISPGTNVTGGSTYQIGQVTGATFLTGDLVELGVWYLDFTASSRQSNMNANQIAYWGPF